MLHTVAKTWSDELKNFTVDSEQSMQIKMLNLTSLLTSVYANRADIAGIEFSTAHIAHFLGIGKRQVVHIWNFRHFLLKAIHDSCTLRSSVLKKHLRLLEELPAHLRTRTSSGIDAKRPIRGALLIFLRSWKLLHGIRENWCSHHIRDMCPNNSHHTNNCGS